MREIEVKILEINVEEVEKKLLSLGAKKIFDGKISTVYFNLQSEVLRIRDFGTKVVLTYKKKLQSDIAKEYEEHEVVVDSSEKMKIILQSLGFKIKREEVRSRISYSFGKAHVDIDFFDNLPPFMEIEAESELEIVAIAKQLGFTKEQLKPWTGGDVRRYYEKLKKK